MRVCLRNRSQTIRLLPQQLTNHFPTQCAIISKRYEFKKKGRVTWSWASVEASGLLRQLAKGYLIDQAILLKAVFCLQRICELHFQPEKKLKFLCHYILLFFAVQHGSPQKSKLPSSDSNGNIRYFGMITLATLITCYLFY